MKKEQQKQLRMSYETYSHFKCYLEVQGNKIHTDYITAINHLKALEPWKLREKANDTAWEHYQTGVKQLRQMGEELFAAAKSTYKDHPSMKMREFWLIKV